MMLNAPSNLQRDLSRALPWMLLAVMAASMALAALSAAHRAPWDDEGEFSDAAWTLSHRGYMGSPVLDAPVNGLPHIGQRTYWVMPLYLAGQAAWYRCFPASVFWTRLFTTVWVPLALYALFSFLARFTGDRAAALLAVAYFGLSYSFLDNAGFARPDVMCCALGLAGLAAYVCLRERSLPAALLASHACMAASLMTHPNGIFHLLGLLALMVWLDRSKIGVRGLLLCALPYVVAVGAWSIYIMQDPATFVAQMRANGANGRWTDTLNPLLILRNEVVERYFVGFGLATRGASMAKALALAAYLAGIAGVLLTPKLRTVRSHLRLLALLGIYFVAMSIFNQKLTYYLVHILPWYAAVLAIWTHALWRGRPRFRMFIAAAAALVVLADCAGIVLRARKQSYVAAQRAAVEFVRANARPSDRIAGEAGLLYALQFDDRLREDKYLGARGGQAPDVVVVDPDMWGHWERTRVADLRQIQDQLRKYRLAYDRDGYRIYLLR